MAKEKNPFETSSDITNKRLKEAFDKLDNPYTLGGYLPETVIGGGKGAAEVIGGIYGLSKNTDLGLTPYKSTYEESSSLKALRDKAFVNTFANSDDYASRIRAKNVYNNQVNEIINRSGGSRAFAVANTAAAADQLNLANLGIDEQQRNNQNRNIQTALGLEGAVIQDKLNKSNDVKYENKDRLEKFLTQLNYDRENTRGAIGLITGGLGDVSQAFGHESVWGKNGSMRAIMKSRTAMEMQRAGIDPYGMKTPQFDSPVVDNNNPWSGFGSEEIPNSSMVGNVLAPENNFVPNKFAINPFTN